MNLSELFGPLGTTLSETLPNLLMALAILVIGWFLAVAVRAGLRKLLGIMQLDSRFESTTSGRLKMESMIATGAFLIIMLFVLVAFFSALNLGSVSAPLEALATKLTNYAPNLVGGVILALIAWVVASLVRKFMTQALGATRLDETLSREADMQPMSTNLGNVLYWLTILLFLPAILGTLQLGGLLTPVQNMVDQMLTMLPNIIGALAIGAIGWFIARLLRDLVSNLLAATGFDNLGGQVGLAADIRLSKLAGLIVFIFVFVPALIAAINALEIDAISEPATQMLATFMAAIPRVFAAIVILTVAFFLARFISGLTTKLLHGFGADEIPQKMGLVQLTDGGLKISRLAGVIVSTFILLLASVEAANQLGFFQVEQLVTTLVQFAGQILLGSIILAAGFWLANLAYKAILQMSGDGVSAIASIARIAILGLVVAMGLRAMGIADDIVNLAFALVLGAVAVAIALSFGLGGREAAGRQMEFWLEKLRR